MCISPVRIRNPNYHSKNPFALKYHDTSSLMINVPCGHCPDCVSLKQMSFTQRVQMESLDNHIFFCTLTYNNDAMPYVETSQGVRLRYAAVDDVQRMIKRLRKQDYFGRPFRYAAVSERGSRSSRPHFHILFFVKRLPDDSFGDILNLEHCMFDAVKLEWRRNLGSTRNPIWQPLFTYVRKMVRGRLNMNFDLHYVNPRTSPNGELDVAFYVSKYMVKESQHDKKLQSALKLNLPLDEYHKIWNLVRSRTFTSVGFGFNDSDTIRSYLRNCIEDSKKVSDFPSFFNKDSGQSFPLSRYYKTKGDIFSVDDFDFFWKKRHEVDNVVIDDSHISEKLRKIVKFDNRLRIIEANDNSSFLNSFEHE